MRAEDIQALVTYRMQRATETLEEARLMQDAGHWNACANRLYYAAFYAVSALLARDRHTVSKHSGLTDSHGFALIFYVYHRCMSVASL